MTKQGKIFDELEGTPLKTSAGDENPFEFGKRLEQAIIENKNKPVALPRKAKTKFIESKFEVTPKEIPTVKQVILGNVPSKSNCYKIITFRTGKQKPLLFSGSDILKMNDLIKRFRWDELRDMFIDGSDNNSHPSLGKTAALKKYENDFFIQANRYRNLNVDEYFEFEIDVYYPTQRSDLDNSLKVVLDCLQKINAIKNDNKCTRIIANKFLDKLNPRIEFIIRKSM